MKHLHPTVSISTALDNMPLSPDAFRVYFHLVKLNLLYGSLCPSYKEIGVHCFPGIQEESARSKAMRAIKELVELNVIRVEKIKPNREFYSNQYFLTNDSEWHQGGVS